MADKIRKLSQALRLGATFRPKCVGYEFKTVGFGQVHSCALGAIWEGRFGNTDFSYSDFKLAFPEVGAVLTDGSLHSVYHDIWSRNDGRNGREQQTREQIADWLESIGL